MTEPDTSPRRGRRARALSPEESAALETRSSVDVTDEASPAPGVRGAVAPPTADTPVPALRKFGRRARIIELSDASDEQPIPSDPEPQADAKPTIIDRDRDGVELGELSVTDAPAPRPAPRFDGKVLLRSERSGGRSLLWIVWALIAIALIVLVALLLTGVVGPGEASALDASLHDLFIDRSVLEEPAA